MPPQGARTTGLAFWEENRARWRGSGGNGKRARASRPVDIDGVIDRCFGGEDSRPPGELPPAFKSPVPLRQLVDLLSDLWDSS